MATNGKRKRYTGAGNTLQQGDNAEEDFGNQTLPVARLPEGFDGVPQDGSVYLAMVRQEAVQYPSIFTAASNPYAVASTSYIKPASRADELGIPGPAWRETFLARFLAMREALSHTASNPLPTLQVGRLPKAKTIEGASKAWYRFIFRVERPSSDDVDQTQGQDEEEERYEVPQSDEEEEDEDGLYNDPVVNDRRRPPPLEPTPLLLARFNMSQILSLLNAIPYWIALRSSTKVSISPKTEMAIHPLLSRWCFSLLGKLDRRLTSDEISILRVLARACIAAISFRRMRLKQDGQSDIEQEEEAGAWIVIAIITGVWGQSDLWMDAEEDLGRVATGST